MARHTVFKKCLYCKSQNIKMSYLQIISLIRSVPKQPQYNKFMEYITLKDFHSNHVNNYIFFLLQILLCIKLAKPPKLTYHTYGEFASLLNHVLHDNLEKCEQKKQLNTKQTINENLQNIETARRFFNIFLNSKTSCPMTEGMLCLWTLLWRFHIN